MAAIQRLGSLIPKIALRLEKNPKVNAEVLDKVYQKERALQKAEYGKIYEELGEIPSMRMLAQDIAEFNTFTANQLQNIKSTKLREALTKLCKIQTEVSVKGWDYNREISNIIESASTLDPVKDKMVIEELTKRCEDFCVQLERVKNGKFVNSDHLVAFIEQADVLAQIPAASRGEICNMTSRVGQVIKKHPNLKDKNHLEDLQEAFKNEPMVTYFGDEFYEVKPIIAEPQFSHPREFDNFLYENYYLNRTRYGVDTSLKRISEDYGTKVFVPKSATDEQADDILREFHAWNKAGGKNVNHEKTLSFDDYDEYLYSALNGNGAAGFAAQENYIRIRTEYFTIPEKDPYPVLRHEKLHRNDQIGTLCKIQKFGKFGENGQYDFTEGGKILTEKKWYRDEFRNAGIPEWHIDYAYKNRAEFIAVASEGNPKAYSEEFKKVLVDLGMPEWFFGIRPFKSYNC